MMINKSYRYIKKRTKEKRESTIVLVVLVISKYDMTDDLYTSETRKLYKRQK